MERLTVDMDKLINMTRFSLKPIFSDNFIAQRPVGTVMCFSVSRVHKIAGFQFFQSPVCISCKPFSFIVPFKSETKACWLLDSRINMLELQYKWITSNLTAWTFAVEDLFLLCHHHPYRGSMKFLFWLVGSVKFLCFNPLQICPYNEVWKEKYMLQSRHSCFGDSCWRT